eukprot:COSAG02_NODE_4900_length_4850_cov_2.842559_2_plen_36_part_00
MLLYRDSRTKSRLMEINPNFANGLRTAVDERVLVA